MPVFIKTIAIILSAAGSSVVAASPMTFEFWKLLLSLRAMALKESGGAIVEAVLFGFLTILHMNEDKRDLAENHARLLLDTYEWVQMVFDRTPSGHEESDRVRTLAAGILVATMETLQKYQRLLMADMVDY